MNNIHLIYFNQFFICIYIVNLEYNMKNNCDKYNKKISEYKKDDIFVVFYMDRSKCIYSYNTIELLKRKQKSFKGYLVKRGNGKDKLKDLLPCLKKTKTSTHFDIKHHTLPIIFYKGKFIGGYTELKNSNLL